MSWFHWQWLFYKLLGVGEPFAQRFEREIRARISPGHRLIRNGSIWVESNGHHPVQLWCPWWARPRWWILRMLQRSWGEDS